jgi:hypothetical protein
MFIESLLQFETVLVENRSILEWIDSDYTYLNAELAEIYGLEGPATGWQRVRLTDARRGGLLTGAAMLTLTSYPHRTSLIRRGNWFLEAIMNRPPPPPKIAVAEIDEQVHAEELTLREKVELHRANSACAVCHDRIDPPGFALESYDAIGRWRTQDGEELIDSSGTLPGLGTFSDAPELKRLIWDQREHFVRGFTEHLLSYALSRRLEYFDVAAIERIVQAASEDDYALGSIIIEIVNSYPFQYVDRQ